MEPNRASHVLHITANWRGRPLETREVIVNLIANTRTSKGLTIQADLDMNSYSKGIKVSDEEMTPLNITPANSHGENGTIPSHPDSKAHEKFICGRFFLEGSLGWS